MRQVSLNISRDSPYLVLGQGASIRWHCCSELGTAFGDSPVHKWVPAAHGHVRQPGEIAGRRGEITARFAVAQAFRPMAGDAIRREDSFPLLECCLRPWQRICHRSIRLGYVVESGRSASGRKLALAVVVPMPDQTTEDQIDPLGL